MNTRQISILAVLSISNIALVFAFQWYIVTYIGSGWKTDALFAAMVVPNLVLAIVSSSLTHVLVPILSVKQGVDFEENAWMFFYLVGFFFIGIAFFLVLSDGYWLPLLLPGFGSEELQLTTNVFEIQVLSIVGTSLVAVLEAASHAKSKFYNVELVKNVVGVIALIALSLSIDNYGIYAAAFIFAFRPLLSVMLMMKHLGHCRHPKYSRKDVKAVWDRLKYLIGGTAYYKTDPLLDRFLLSMATAGSITIYHLSQQIYSAGSTVMNRAISAPMVPILSRHADAGEWFRFRSDYKNRLYFALGLSLLAIMLIYFIGHYFLELLFHHKNFSESSVDDMWILMIALSGMFVAGSVGQILASSFYAIGNTKTPTHIGILGYTVGIFLKIGGFYYYGVIGVAIAASMYYTLNAGMLYYFLRTQIDRNQRPEAGTT